jgi:ATP-dependent DNA helicase RecG
MPNTLSEDQLLRISERLASGLEQGESHFREFKSAIDRSTQPPKPREVKSVCRDIAETLIAFANADGGELFVGVEDDGSVSGVPHKEDLVRAILAAPKSHVHPQTPLPGPTVSRFDYDGKSVIYFQTAKSTNRVHLTADGRCLQRFDTENRPVAAEEIQYNRQEQTSREYDRAFVDGATVHALDIDLVHRVSKRIAGGQSPEKLLQYFDLAEYRYEGLAVRRAALLLFATDVSKWHPRCQIRIARVAGTKLGFGKEYNISSREDHIVRGNILRILEVAWDALRPYLARTVLVQSGVFAENLVYPELACQEALINAVAHRDYSIEGKVIEILVFDDRLEVNSPGGLLSSVSPDDLRTGKRSHQSRNVYVARVLRELGYMREMGEGMLRIFATMRDSDLVPPEIKTEPTSFELILHHRSVFSPKDQEWLAALKAYNLTRDEQRTVLLGRDGNLLSTNEIVKASAIADIDEFRKLVERLRRKGILYSATANRRAGVKNRSERRWAIRPPDQVEQYRAELFSVLKAADDHQLEGHQLRKIAAKLSPSSPYREKLPESLKLLGLVDERLRPLPALRAVWGHSLAPVKPRADVEEHGSREADKLFQVGKVRALKPNRYGFIETEAGVDHFFHSSDLLVKAEWDEMQIGNTVEFEPGTSPKGPIAKKVRLLRT